MMTSSNWNIFLVTVSLCREFTGHWWILLIKASDAELWYFLSSVAEFTIEETNVRLVIWDDIAPIMTSLQWLIHGVNKSHLVAFCCDLVPVSLRYFSIGIHIRWKFRFAITLILTKRSLQNFAHVTTALYYRGMRIDSQGDGALSTRKQSHKNIWWRHNM